MSDYFKKLQREKAFGQKREEKKSEKKKYIKPFSKKRQKANRTLAEVVKDLLEKRPICEIRSPECTGQAETAHHLKGRIGAKLTDPRFLVPSCGPCNTYVEKNDKWARANGFKLSKHEPNGKK